MFCFSDAQAQMMKKNKTIRELQRINRIKDPEQALQRIEETRAGISPTNPKMRNFLIYLSLKESDLYIRIGDFQRAESILLLTVEDVSSMKLNWSSAMLPFYEGTVMDAYDKLAYFYLNTGNLRKAEQLFNESKTKRNDIFPKRSVHRIHPIAGLGSLHFQKGEIDKANQYFQEAERSLNRATTTFYDFDNVSRLYLSDQVENALMQGRHDEAFSYINKLAIASSGVAKFGSRIGSRLEIARILELKARYYLLEDDYRRAQEYLTEANKYYSTKISSSDIKFKLLKTQAMIYWFDGHAEKADEAFLALIQAYRQHIDANFISMSEYEKEQFYNTLKSDFNLFNAYALTRPESPRKALMEAMLNNTINTKALLLNASNKIKNSILQSGDITLIQKLDLWESAKAQLSAYYFDKDAIQKIDSLEKEVEVLENEINAQSHLFTDKSNPREWKQVQSALGKGEAAIEMVRINTLETGHKNYYGKNNGLSDSAVYVAFIIKSELENVEYILFTDGNRMESRGLSFYRNSIVARAEDDTSYETFWQPLKPSLKGVSKVYFSPDGVFNQLNLNTLKNPISQDYLIDELELVYITNTADLLLQEEQINDVANAVLVGRPSFDVNITPTNQPGAQYGTRYVMTDELVSFKDQEFADLPGTEQEISRIEKTLTQRNISVQSFIGDLALEENVKGVDGPSILHIATHGFFVDDAASAVNPMIRSGLVLAGVKNKEQQENADGILTAYEATNLRLDNTSLVVLSACETGLGEVRNGQGVYGLQRAIIVAGANNLLMSLWKVDDEATALLMISFYNNWQYGNNQSAFREAQLTMRKQYRDPFYWGAFIMLGK